MQVSDLAKQLDVTVEAVLGKLRSLKLKAKSGDQELSAAVVTVVKGEIIKDVKASMKEIKQVPVVEEKKKAAEEEKPKSVEKAAAKPTAKKTSVAKGKDAGTMKPAAEPKAAKTAKSVSGTAKSRTAAKTVSKINPKLKTTFIKRHKVITAPTGPAKPVETKPEASAKAKPVVTEPPHKKELLKEESKISVAATPKPVMGQDVPQPQVPGAELETGTLTDLEVQLPISVKDLSVKMQQKPSVILKSLMKMGLLAHINQNLDGDVAKKILAEYGFSLSKVKTKENAVLSTLF